MGLSSVQPLAVLRAGRSWGIWPLENASQCSPVGNVLSAGQALSKRPWAWADACDAWLRACCSSCTAYSTSSRVVMKATALTAQNLYLSEILLSQAPMEGFL
ncbi:hypothetical protein PFLmoz3_04387 [Pseudomonas fluorescens]|uniref:Uncharacterized protein n=1 Tax=Pseudomonas fluorescens TaxID=294 RepID=A0A125QHY1_PSEFL|nr:hypothetical protein PFLmoz3_04387 [Pseudomonas fluorescens]